MAVLTLTPPVGPVVSLGMVYDQLRLGIGLTSHPDDALLARLVAGATDRVETMTRRALVARELRYTVELPHQYGRRSWAWSFGWRQRPIELPRPPLLEVVAVQFFDDINILRSVDVADYRVISSSETQEARIEFIDGWVAPQIFDRSDAVSVVFRAGYATPEAVDGVTDYGANVPQTIRDAVLLLVDQAYNARLPAEDIVIDARIESMLLTYQVARA